MGAKTTYVVRVLTTVEAEIEVSAIGSSDAIAKAEREPGVIKVLEAIHHSEWFTQEHEPTSNKTRASGCQGQEKQSG